MRVQVLIFNDESDEDVLGRIVITHAEVSGSLKAVTITGEVETIQGASLPVGWLPRTLYPGGGGSGEALRRHAPPAPWQERAAPAGHRWIIGCR
jgi:hypothetical protein